MTPIIVATFMAVLGIAALAAWHSWRWHHEHNSRQVAYKRRLTERLERIREDEEYDRLKAIAAQPFDQDRFLLGDAMLLAQTLGERWIREAAERPRGEHPDVTWARYQAEQSRSRFKKP